MSARSRSKAVPGPFPPNRLRELRLARDLSQVALGALAGLRGPSVHRLEHRTRELTWDVADRLAAVLGVQPGDLFLPPRRLPPGMALARKLAALTPQERDACVRLARKIAAGRKGTSELQP